MKKSRQEFDIAAIEKKWQSWWEHEQIYKFDRKSKKKIFSIDTPPPYISGRPHMGHAYSYTLFDIIARFKRMQGFNVLLPIGFDDNGHPTERYVEQKYNISSAEMPRERFIELCRRETEALEKLVKADLISFGLGFDWSFFYSTIGDLAIKTAQYSFLDLYNKGLLYRAEEPTLWCVHCRTALAQADVEDYERETALNYINFKLEDDKTITIATTRPELLAACVAVFVHPNDARYSSLIGKKAVVPIFGHVVPIMTEEAVNPDFGTGAVMLCTFGDKTDIEWWKKHKLDSRLILNEEGKLKIKNYDGLTLEEAKVKVIEELKKQNLLLKQEKLHQTVGVCWRCHNPVEFLMTKEWRLKLVDYKEELLKFGRKVKWCPSFFLKRYEEWVKGLSWDWVISRARHYGVPMPVWYCKNCGKIILATEKELPIDPLHAKPKRNCSCGSNEFEPESRVFDTWWTSSLTPQIVLRWTEKNSLFTKCFPEDLRPQGYEIIRTWAFYTIVKAFFHFRKIPWKTAMINGMALDPKGRAMHKALGNVIDPIEMIKSYGADALRFWALSSKLGEDIPFQEKELTVGRKTIIKLLNAARFVSQHAKKIQPKKLEAFDTWLLSKLQRLIKECTESFNSYALSKAKTALEQFFWHTFCDDWLEIVKRRVYQQVRAEERASAQFTLYNSFLTLLKLFAPIMPHITEELYQKYFKKDEKIKSIHLSAWPRVNRTFIDTKLEKIGDDAIEIISKVRAFKAKAQKSLKTEIVLTIEKEKLSALKPFLEDLKAVCNAKVDEGKFKIKFV